MQKGKVATHYKSLFKFLLSLDNSTFLLIRTGKKHFWLKEKTVII